MEEMRRGIRDPETLAVLAHPLRLDLLGYLMSAGPATASACARAVGDSPSNCSYHLRVLAARGLVAPEASGDGRERPWRALITGFFTETPGSEQGDPSHPTDAAQAEAMLAASLQLDYHLAREHLRMRGSLPPEWREVDAHAQYGLRVTPEELRRIGEAIDAIVRPYIAATRPDAPEGASVAHLSVTAFPRPGFER